MNALKAAGILAASTIVSYLFYRLGFSDVNIVMSYLLGIIFIAMSTSLSVGVVSSAAAVLLFNFFFTEPRFTFTVYDGEYIFIFLVMFVVALLTSALTSKIKKQAEEAAKREERTKALYSLGRTLLEAGEKDAILAAAKRALKSAIPGIGEVEISSETEDPPSEDGAAAHLVLDGPAGRHGYLSYAISRPNGTVSEEEAGLIQALADQLSLALDREKNAEAHEQQRIKAETERNRLMILRSISHDLRTPLASIAGAGSALMEESESLDAATKKELLRTIVEESTWLAEVVDNLLSLSRLQSGTGLIGKTPEVLEDILFSAVERVRRRAGAASITVTSPEELIVLPMDGTLIEQALINILDNALKYSPEGSPVWVRADTLPGGREVEIVVEDEGPGFSNGAEKNDFGLFRSADGDRARRGHGAGLGLGICKAIVEAHGGRLSSHNRQGGGARVAFTLPMGGTGI